jgi:hypothetical protein
MQRYTTCSRQSHDEWAKRISEPRIRDPESSKTSFAPKGACDGDIYANKGNKQKSTISCMCHATSRREEGRGGKKVIPFNVYAQRSGNVPPDHDLESSPRRRSGSSYLEGILDHAPQLAWKSEVPLSSVPDSGRLLCGEELPRVVPASRGRYRNRL